MPWTLTVTELNDYVRRTLAGDAALRFVSLRGEVSDYKPSASGHWYFSLKDEQSRISCICYRSTAQQVPFALKNGLKVILTGGVGLYTATGAFQFYVEKISLDGVGELYLKLEALKARLLQEGLFDVSRKKPLPAMPRCIGVVTSRTGAVIHDIATVSRRRFPSIQIILRPAQVQGEGAAEDIAAGIRELSALPQIDVMIVGRGGGSLEELWAFNEEVVVRAIAACPIPIVSAVGHEVDVTLADLAADVRAATPSAAAEICVPDTAQLRAGISQYQNALRKALERKILQQRTVLTQLEKRMANSHPRTQLQNARLQVAHLRQRTETAAQKTLQTQKMRLQQLETKLSMLGPRQALSRGYALLLNGSQVVTSVQDVAPQMTILLQDGSITVQTMQTRKEDPFGQS